MYCSGFFVAYRRTCHVWDVNDHLGLHNYSINAYGNTFWLLYMILVVRKPVLGDSDQVPHKPGCTVTEDGERLGI